MSDPASISRRPAIPFPPDASVEDFVMPWCFGCGSDNPHSLGYRPWLEEDRVVGELEFAERFQGGPGVAHGGAIAAFLDDLMGYVPMMHRVPAVTADLQVSFRRPVPLGRKLRGEAWLVEREGRKLRAEAIGVDSRGLVVEAKALFVTIRPDHFSSVASKGDDDERTLKDQEYYP